jgi:hypothetical protein
MFKLAKKIGKKASDNLKTRLLKDKGYDDPTMFTLSFAFDTWRSEKYGLYYKEKEQPGYIEKWVNEHIGYTMWYHFIRNILPNGKNVTRGLKNPKEYDTSYSDTEIDLLLENDRDVVFAKKYEDSDVAIDYLMENDKSIRALERLAWKACVLAVIALLLVTLYNVFFVLFPAVREYYVSARIAKVIVGSMLVNYTKFALPVVTVCAIVFLALERFTRNLRYGTLKNGGFEKRLARKGMKLVSVEKGKQFIADDEKARREAASAFYRNHVDSNRVL